MSTVDNDGSNGTLMLPELREDLERGLRFANVMVTVTQDQSNEAVAYVQALIDLLVRKSLISEEELEEPLERTRIEVAEVLMPCVRLADMGDKYAENQTVEIDCPNRLPLCQGRCCTFRFYLTKQDLDEGLVLWDYGNPYWIRQASDGYCVHCDPDTRLCSTHATRPHICRRYDCRNDKRVWLDFEQRIPAPRPEPGESVPIAMAEVALRNSKRETDGDALKG